MVISENPRSDIQPACRRRRTRPRGRSALPESDYYHLLVHLETCNRDRGPRWALLTYVLQNKLMNTEPTREPVASDIVVGGSHVSYSANGGAVETVLLVHGAQPGKRKQDIVSVSSLLGATLIGMRVGQRAPLLCEDGSVRSLVVIDSVPPRK